MDKRVKMTSISIDEIFEETAQYSDNNSLNQRDRRHLRLVAEEMLGITRLAGQERKAVFSIDGDDKSCILKLQTEPYKGEESGLDDRNIDSFSGVSGKIGLLFNSSYDSLSKNEKEIQDIGVYHATAENLKEMEIDSSEDAYVWSLGSFSLSSYFTMMDDDDDTCWIELASSVLSSIADDIRIFVFQDRIVFSVYMSFVKNKDKVKQYDISPEFDALKKIPVAKNYFQIKLIQMMYSGLAKKQVTDGKRYVIQHKITVPSSPHGKLTLIEYSPVNLNVDKPTPVILFLHGGAYMFPALPYHYRLAKELSEKMEIKVMLLIHDLVPGSQPPVQIKEALEAYCYIQEHATELWINPDKIVVMGDSSGGTMAAALTLLTRDRDITPPAGSLLLYPSLDVRLNTKSMNEYTDVPVINGDAIKAYKKIIHSDKTEGPKYYYSPAEADSLSGICKTYVETAEFDALHDEGIAFAKRLKAEGVDVTLNETKGTVHAFDMAKESSIRKAAIDKRIEFIKSLL